MIVLVACEESQRVCCAFRKKGHIAFSCDILDCSGGHPEWHIKCDVLNILNPTAHTTIFESFAEPEYYIGFVTCDGVYHRIFKWDLIIAHPPCVYLTLSGNRWFNFLKNDPIKVIEREKKREKAIEFFKKITDADCEKIAVENPIGIMSTVFRKPDQIIQPWEFALSDEEKTVKSTCLWLKGLPKLKPRFIEKPSVEYFEWIDSSGKKKRQSLWYYSTRCLPYPERSLVASKTFFGIASAMAEQWG